MADPGTLSGKVQWNLGLEASKNLIFQKLTSKIDPDSNFAIFFFTFPQKLIGNRYEAEISRKCKTNVNSNESVSVKDKQINQCPSGYQPHPEILTPPLFTSPEILTTPL